MSNVTQGCGEHLILFTRYPEPGVTKTRLIPALGPEGAAALQRRMTEQVMATVTALQQVRQVAMEIRYSGGDREWLARWLSTPAAACRPQGEGDLGDRLAGAFADAFAEGRKRVVIVGSDCPGVTPAILASGFELLRHHDVVLGPATDGGYYLIGLSQPGVPLFGGIPWGGATVLAETMARIEALSLSVAQLPRLADVDRPEDLVLFDHPPGP